MKFIISVHGNYFGLTVFKIKNIPSRWCKFVIGAIAANNKIL